MFITVVIRKVVLFLELTAVICFCAWNMILLVFHVVLSNVSSPLAWAQSCCGLTGGVDFLSSHQRRSTTTAASWAQPELMEMRQKCSHASCDGPVHCLRCLICFILYLIPTSIFYENAPFWINKSCFLKCVFFNRFEDIPHFSLFFLWLSRASDFVLFKSASWFGVMMRQTSYTCEATTKVSLRYISILTSPAAVFRDQSFMSWMDLLHARFLFII